MVCDTRGAELCLKSHQDVQSWSLETGAQCPDSVMGRSGPGSPLQAVSGLMSQMSQGHHTCHALVTTPVLPSLPLSCQQWLITPGVTPGGRPGPDTRQTPELSRAAPGVRMIVIRSQDSHPHNNHNDPRDPELLQSTSHLGSEPLPGPAQAGYLLMIHSHD